MFCINVFDLATFEDLAVPLRNLQVLGYYAAAIVFSDYGRNVLHLQDLTVKKDLFLDLQR